METIFTNGDGSTAEKSDIKPVRTHFYYCRFSIYKHGEMDRRPHQRSAYIEARNAKEAYRKAQVVCNSPKFSSLSDTVICRHEDIRRCDAEEALQDINDGWLPLFEVHLEK